MPVILQGPELPEPPASCPLGFCAVCAASWKAAAFERQGPAVQAADKDPTFTLIVLEPLPPLTPPAPAVTTALIVLPMPPGVPATGSPTVAPMPVCWTHAQAVQFTGSGLLIANSSGPGPGPGRDPFSGGVPLDRPR